VSLRLSERTDERCFLRHVAEPNRPGAYEDVKRLQRGRLPPPMRPRMPRPTPRRRCCASRQTPSRHIGQGRSETWPDFWNGPGRTRHVLRGTAQNEVPVLLHPVTFLRDPSHARAPTSESNPLESGHRARSLIRGHQGLGVGRRGGPALLIGCATSWPERHLGSGRLFATWSGPRTCWP
jgi:hypothetical protein